jgi:AcrR family transcriptional regulator
VTTPVSSGPPIVEPGSPFTLPVADAPRPALRADAQRNRERVLCAAARVIERSGAAGLTMEAVADEAGVGKGTVFRRFGDRSSLLHALLDEEERRQQEAIIHGPPPLGPGASPLDRLIAFGDARLEHLARHGELLSAAEDPRFGSGEPHPVAVATRMHVTHLLKEAGHSDQCASVLAAALLSYLSGQQIHHLRTVEGQSDEALRGAWATLATGAIGASEPQAA